ncbi:FIVAR domain-containing protein [Brochothrix thermosphacta]|uniref:FIVAR domain-containing protein n=1 Tax=Brochothrix thermosphacta TaxID=2756 RepID=UPI00083F67AC|nr:FIVAR domain-containing protein [Brochothrix thermosphacta]ODJ67751.1 hypothetical protein BFR37_04785 [Brochothrix thermosphacta]
MKKEVKVDFSALKTTVTNANKLTSKGYTTASFNSFAKVRTASTKVLNNAKSTQAQVNKANTDLVNAQKALVKVANFKTLKSTVTKANKVHAKGYTKASWKTFSTVRNTANKVLKNNNATQAQVNKANTDLVKAQKSLKKVAVKVNKNTLKATVTKANKVKAKGYTKASFNSFAKVRTASTKILNNAKATQAQVNKANTDLVKAQKSLETEAVKVNKNTLKATVTKANKVKAKGYTKASFNSFAKVRTASTKVLNNAKATQAQVNKANTDLVKAQKSLKKEAVKVNKNTLKATVTKANKVKVKGYTKASFNSFAKVRTASTKVLNNAKATQAQVNKANTDLLKAQKSLKKEAVKVNKNTLKATVTKANKVKAKGYTKASFNSFAKVRTASTKVLNNAKATQAQVNKANTDLVKAQKSLKKVAVKVNKNTLKATVTKANKVKAKGYTKASFNRFAKVRTASTKVLNNAKATQAQVNKANTDLLKAQKSLKKEAVKVNKNTLKATVTKANKVKAKGYTKASFNSFAKVRTASTKVLNNAKATQAQVNKANTDLVKAQKSLKKVAVKVNKNTLKATVTKANKVKAKGYTKASFNKFAKVRKASTKVLNNAKATQAQVNKANKDLNQGMTALKKV